MSSEPERPVVTTARLLLRHIALADAPFLLRLLNEPSFLANIGDRQVRSLEQARAYIASGPMASYEHHGFGLYLLLLRSTGEPIGMCGLVSRVVLPDPDVGFALVPEHWRQGYALESATGVVELARDRLGLRRLLGVVLAENVGSIRVLERLGMRREGTVRLSEDDVDLELYGMDLRPAAEVPGDVAEADVGRGDRALR